MEWYVILLITSAGLFVITTAVSLIFGNLDLDADADVGSGFELSDVISFKGLLHFATGFSLTLTLMGGCMLLSAAAGVLTGIVFVVTLFYLYRMVFSKLQQNIRYTTTIINMDAEVYYWNDRTKSGEVFVTLEGRPVTVTLTSTADVHYEKGQKLKVTGTRHSVSPAAAE